MPVQPVPSGYHVENELGPHTGEVNHETHRSMSNDNCYDNLRF